MRPRWSNLVMPIVLGLAIASNGLAAIPGSGDGLIVFQSTRTGNSEIYVARDDGTGLVNVSNTPGNDRFAAISPDGSRIAYASNRTGTWGIYVAEFDPATLSVGATDPLVVGTTDSTGYWSLDWMLDGEHLLVESRRGSVHRVDRVDVADGTWSQWIPTTLASGATFDAHNPQISVDGSQIYVFRNPPFNGYAGDVYVYDADGTNERRLTNLPGVQTYHPTEIIVDGTPTLLFTHVTSTSQIYSGDLASLSLTNISNPSFDEGAPRRAEGPGASDYEGWYMFHSWRASGTANVYLRTYDGSQELQVTTEGGGSCDWWVADPVTTVAIDVKPGSDPNCFNINGHGVVPVAILGSESFDVGAIAPESLRFAGLAVRVRGNGAPQCAFEDSNLDGWIDYVCQFVDDPSTWVDGEGTATLTGDLLDGGRIEGTDAICVVP